MVYRQLGDFSLSRAPVGEVPVVELLPARFSGHKFYSNSFLSDECNNWTLLFKEN